MTSHFNSTPRPFGILLPEAQAAANPPFINWFREPQAARYRVTLTGRDGSLSFETVWNFLTPPEALGAGPWLAAVEALDDSGRVIARDSRETVLPASSLSRPRDMNRIVRRPDSRMLASDEKIEAIRRATGERGRWRDALLAAAANIDAALLAGPPEPGAYPGGVWEFETWKNNNALCIAMEDAIFGCTVAWRISGEAKYLDTARRLIAHTVAWDPTGTTGVWENDHSDEALLHAFALAYDTFGDALPPDERKALAACIRERCRDIYEFVNPFHRKELSCGLMGDPSNNHVWFVAEAMGTGALALLPEDPEAAEWVALAAQLHPGAFYVYGDPDGGWHEGIDYWSYSLQFVFPFTDALLDATGVDLYDDPWLRRTAEFKLLTHPPEGAYVPFGDCKHHKAMAIDRLITMRLASRYADALAWKYVESLAGEEIKDLRYLPHALLWSAPEPSADAPAPPPPPKVMHYRDMGWVVLNSDPFDGREQVLFAFRSGGKHAEAMGHSHADLNSFILCAGGEKLLWDGGYYDSYGSPHHNHYSRHSMAHNTLLLDGEGQNIFTRGAGGRILRCEGDERGLLVEGDASGPLAYMGKLAWFKRLVELRDLSELVVSDDILARDSYRMSLLLNSVFPIVYDPGARAITIRGERWILTGRLETDEKINATITTTFDQPPGLLSHLLDTHNEYPDQYRLELATARKVSAWKPRMVFKLGRV